MCLASRARGDDPAVNVHAWNPRVAVADEVPRQKAHLSQEDLSLLKEKPTHIMYCRTYKLRLHYNTKTSDDSSVSGSPSLSVALAKMQEALRVCLQLDLRGREEKRRGSGKSRTGMT